MVRIMNYELRITNWAATRAILLLGALSLVFCNSAFLFAQQPQAPAGAPLYSVNAKYVNGMAPGYWPAAGNGLMLIVSSGTAYCGNPPQPVPYAGGTLTLSPSTTNYVYLDPAANCAPSVSTTPFSAGQIPVAKVVTGASSISALTDERTWSSPNPAAVSSSGAVQISSLGTNQNITLSPSGTGASVITNLADKGGQVFNVKAYGAVGDGATNDSPSFQAAYAAAVAAGGGTVYIPQTATCYLLNTAINMTNASTSYFPGVTIQGAAFGPKGAGSTSSQVCGNTGGIVFDLAGTDGVIFRSVYVTAQKAGLSNPSTIGLYIARNSGGSGGQNIVVVDSTFNMLTHTSGTSYTFGAYLYGSEDAYFARDHFFADYPLVVSATNAFSQNSAFITEATGTQSETQDSFTDIETNGAGLGPAVYFSGTADMTLTGHSWNSSSANPYPSALYNYALQFMGANNFMHVKWRQEGYPGWAYIRLTFKGSQLYGTSAPGSSPPVHGIEFNDTSTQLINDVFNIGDDYSTPSSNYYYDSTDASPTGVNAIDNVSFYCGKETNCLDIPVGNSPPGGTTPYVRNIRYTSSSTNVNPTVTTKAAGTLTQFPNSAANIQYGSGAPSGSCVTPSLYLRTDGGSGSTLYVCESGAWAAK